MSDTVDRLLDVKGASAKIAFSVRHAAQATDLSERSLWRFIRAGELAIARIGTHVIITRAALEDFLASRVDSTGAPVKKAPPHIIAKVNAAGKTKRTAKKKRRAA